MEKVEDIIKKIPSALRNLMVEKKQAEFIHNYTINVLLTSLKDTNLQKNLHENPAQYIEYLSKL